MICQCEECSRLTPAEKMQADIRARELFLSFLDEDQLATFKAYGYIYVQGSDGNRHKMWLNSSYSGNTLIMMPTSPLYASIVGGKPGELRPITLCAYPQRPAFGWLPTFDRYLGQMLAIMTDVEHFKKTAYA